MRNRSSGDLPWIGIVFALTFAACNSDDGGSSGGPSCQIEQSGFTSCIDYTGSAYDVTSVATTACDNTTDGTFKKSGCATSGRVGSCKVNAGTSTEYVMRYYDGYNDTTADASCDGLSGSYSSG